MYNLKIKSRISDKILKLNRPFPLEKRPFPLQFPFLQRIQLAKQENFYNIPLYCNLEAHINTTHTHAGYVTDRIVLKREGNLKLLVGVAITLTVCMPASKHFLYEFLNCHCILHQKTITSAFRS